MKSLKFALVMIMVLSSFISGCAQNVSSDTYTGGEVGVVSKVKKGIISD